MYWVSIILGSLGEQYLTVCLFNGAHIFSNPQKMNVKCNIMTYLPLKDNIQLFPIPDTEDVYPVAELLLKKQTKQNQIAYYRKVFFSVVSSCCLILLEATSEFIWQN